MKYELLILFASFIFITSLKAQYCDALGLGDEYISGVEIGTISNTGTSDSDYHDYTSLSTDLYQGQTSVSITITNGNSYSSDDVGVWIDWNQDKDFSDASENVVCHGNNGGEGTFSFNVPATAILGTTRMRVRIKYDGADCGSACGDTDFGEVEDYSIHVVTAPSCDSPSDLLSSNITTSSAELAWTDHAGASLWDIELGAAGFNRTGTPTQSGVSNPYTYSGLSANTSYDWYVRAQCSGGGYSLWVGANNYKTLCNAKTAPWSDGYESHSSTTNSTWDECWTSDPTATISQFRWDLTDNGRSPTNNTGPYSAHNGTHFAYCEANSGSLNDMASLYSPTIDINGLTSPQLSFYYYLYGSNIGTLHIDIYDGSSWTNDVETIVGQQQSGSFEDWLRKNIDLSSYSGEIQIRFRAERGDGPYGDICIDDFYIDESTACHPPTQQEEDNITSSSAELEWTDNTDASSWDIELGSAGFTPTGTPTQVGVSNSYTYSDLTAYTDYDWYVRANCGGGSSSSWSNKSTFKTLRGPAAVQSLPFTEDWETNSIPLSWNFDAASKAILQTSSASKHNGSYGLEQYGNSNSSYSRPSDIDDAYTKAISGGANENRTTWNKCSVDLSSASKPYLIFWYAMQYNFDDNYNNFWVQVSTDGSTWTSLFSTQTNGSDIPYTEKEIDLSAYSGTAQLYIRFFHNGKNSGQYLYLDDIEVLNISCHKPSDQTESSITSSTATLGWTAVGSASNWQVEYGEAGFTQGTGTTVSCSTNSYNLTGLDISTSYDWYVRSDCGGGDYSDWIGYSRFSTDGSSVVDPSYLECFDAVSTPAFPAFVTVENTNSDAYQWETTTTTYYSAPNCVKIHYNASVAMDDWFFTPGLNLIAGKTYEVGFIYVTSGIGSEKLAVDYGTSATSASMSGSPIYDITTSTASWTCGSATFSPTSSGIYYVGFHGHSAANQHYLFLDDIQVQEVVANTIWTGSSSNNWHKDANWSNGVPSNTTDVEIPYVASNTYPILANYSKCHDITITSTTSGTGELLYKDFLHIDNIASVERYIPKWTNATDGWHALSSPVSLQDISTEFVDITATPISTNVDFYRWSEAGNLWINIKNSAGNYNQGSGSAYFSNDASPDFETGKGYLVSYGSNVTKSFSGNFNYNDVAESSLSYTPSSSNAGWHLLGNPYACALYWNNTNWSLSHIDATAKIWDEGHGSYTDISAGTGIIPAMNGFWVHVNNAAGGSLTIDASDRTYNSTAWYKSKEEKNTIILWVFDEENQTAQQSILRTNPEATYGFDTKYDSHFLKGMAPQFYSSNHSLKLSTNSIPEFSENIQIPFSFIKNESNQYTIKAEGIQSLNPQENVFLTDLQTNTTQLLNKNPIYKFTAGDGDEENRFLIYFGTTGVDESAATESNIRIYESHQHIHIYISNPENASANIYNSLGQLLVSQNIGGQNQTSISTKGYSGLIIISVINSGNIHTRKFIIE